MFGWLRKRREPPADEPIACQPPNEVFPWPKGVVLTAVDEVTIAVPAAMFDPGQPIGRFVFGPDDMEFGSPAGSDVVLIRLRPGMSVSLAKSVQAYVVADDGRPRRLKPSGPGVKGPSGSA